MLTQSLRSSPMTQWALPHLRTAKLTGQAARAAVRRGGAVLMYHQVVDTPVSIWDTAVSPRHFREHMEALADSGRPVLPFGAFVAALCAGRLPPRAIAITFDDGYADNAAQALPVLEELGLPATFFVTACAVDAPGEMWWDELERILLTLPDLPDHLDIRIGERDLSFDIDGTPADSIGWFASTDEPRCGRQRALVAIWQELTPRSLDDKEAACVQLAAWAGVDAEPRATHRMLTAAELARMAASTSAEIGSHTMTHASLPASDDLAYELARSREALSAHVGAPVDVIAYPSGHYDERVRAATADAGYVAAASCDLGAVRPGTDPLAVPRLMVRDWTGREFARRLRALG
jgi:peptidoglycan/xylan/chitin deacetylase (PgdA/CDA1 family)